MDNAVNGKPALAAAQAASDTGSEGRSSPWALALGSVGVVYGDIGTSPLYTMQEAVNAAGTFDTRAVLGVVSLIFWALTISVTLKYVTQLSLAMRIP